LLICCRTSIGEQSAHFTGSLVADNVPPAPFNSSGDYSGGAAPQV
jgi:hypothetical protein